MWRISALGGGIADTMYLYRRKKDEEESGAEEDEKNQHHNRYLPQHNETLQQLP